MKYMGMPAGMWVLYKKSFGENLVSVLGFSKSEAAEITAGAKHEYKKIIDNLSENTRLLPTVHTATADNNTDENIDDDNGECIIYSKEPKVSSAKKHLLRC